VRFLFDSEHTMKTALPSLSYVIVI
jgi:hypothetical protein